MIAFPRNFNIFSIHLLHLLILFLSTMLAEHELLLELLEELSTSLNIHKKRINLPDVRYVNFRALSFLRHEV